MTQIWVYWILCLIVINFNSADVNILDWSLCFSLYREQTRKYQTGNFSAYSRQRNEWNNNNSAVLKACCVCVFVSGSRKQKVLESPKTQSTWIWTKTAVTVNWCWECGLVRCCWDRPVSLHQISHFNSCIMPMFLKTLCVMCICNYYSQVELFDI